MTSLSIKLATTEHSQDIWKWRNDPATKAMSLNQEDIPWENHQAWYRAVLNDNQRYLYAGFLGKTLIGMVRFDKCEDKSNCYIVSINIDPEKRGQGIGTPLLSETIKKFWEDVPDANFIDAEIIKENKASINIFESFGFQKESAKTYRLMRE